MNSSEDEMEWYLTTVLDQYVVSSNPHVRQASSIWLLAVVKKCSSHQALQSRLKKLQSAFMQLLSENDGEKINIYITLPPTNEHSGGGGILEAGEGWSV